MSLNDWLVAGSIFLACFTQSLAGFGSALVGMALLVPLIGGPLATPLIALISPLLEIVLLGYYRESIQIRSVLPLVFASILGIPVGVLTLRQIPEGVFMGILGLVVAGYAVYALLNLHLPRLAHPAWALLFGLAAGLLGGAYNTSGPPVIIYGDCRRWSPAEFKANLQGFFLISSTLVAIGHMLGGNIQPDAWRYFWIGLAAMLLGLVAGLLLEKRISAGNFRKLVLGLLVVLGGRLILSAIL